MRLCRFLLFIVLCQFLSNGMFNSAIASNEQCITEGWPSDRSELKPDPSLVRGTLSNGLRYVLKKNSKPEDRVALFLTIQAGALHETENQQGVAHFLEHMLFNGTTHFAAGTLVEYFQSLGMDFGGDVNAYTSYKDTTYHIVLPEGTSEYLNKGFLVLKDYAREALLLESEVDRERGVILAEKRSRDSASYRTHIRSIQERFNGTLLADRQIIGKEEVLRGANSELLREFYDAWYRPENMVLTAVGDFNAKSVEQIIIDQFGSLQGVGRSGICPEYGLLDGSGIKSFYLYEPELGSTEVSIETLWNEKQGDDSLSVQRDELHRYLSIMMLNDRLEREGEENSSIYSRSQYYSGDMLGRFRYSVLSATTDSENWNASLEILDTLLRQVLNFGFTEEELQKQKYDLIASLESGVLTADGRYSTSIARSIIHHIRENRVFMSPQQELSLYKPMLEKITLDEVNGTFRNDWKNEGRLISVKGNTDLKTNNPEDEILSVYAALQSNSVHPYRKKVLAKFPYLEMVEGDKNSVANEKEFSRIDVTQITLKNNVVVSLKPTEYEPNTVRVVIDVGSGKQTEPMAGMAMVAEDIVNDSGTGTLSRSELSDVLAGSSVDISFAVTNDSFRWRGSAIEGDYELLLQVLYAVIEDIGIRESMYFRAMDDMTQSHERFSKDIEGAIPLYVNRFLASGDRRVGFPTQEEIQEITYGGIKKWLLEGINASSMEISIVGDFDPGQMRDLLIRYFGGLPVKKLPERKQSALVFPGGDRLDLSVDSSINKSLLVVSWKTEDFWNISRTRRLNLLADVFKEKLRLSIRERLGASYSVSVHNMSSLVYEDYGKLEVRVIVEPGREEEILSEILKTGSELKRGEITEDELVRVKTPLLTSLKDTVQNNRYWLNSVLTRSGRYPEFLEWPLTLIDDYSSISVDDIKTYSSKYLVSENMATVIIKPLNSLKKVEKQ